jgi:osmotically-inducible protein OsmY
VQQLIENFRRNEMKRIATVFLLTALSLSIACSNVSNISYKDSVEKALLQADLKDVSVAEDKDKNTITLSGVLHSDDAKTKAADVAKSAASPRIIANEISVQPVGVESEAKSEASALDDAIEKNYKAALISTRLDKQDISFHAKNGVLILSGKVKTVGERRQAQQLAAAVPHVQQVLNQIQVRQ